MDKMTNRSMGTTTMSLKKRSVHQPGDDNAPPYWTRKRTKMTKTTNHSIPLNRPESMPYLLPSQTRRNTMSLVLSLGRRKAKDQPPERDPLRQAIFGPGLASAPTPPHLLLPLRQIGIISKHILDNINEEIIKVTKANLWRSTSNVIK